MARVLKDAEHWSHAVFHAQQAAEHVIKAAMLRTCGVTGDEFRGSNGHSLRSLMQQTGLTSPVAHDALDRLSKAYLASRYAAFPPRGAVAHCEPGGRRSDGYGRVSMKPDLSAQYWCGCQSADLQPVPD